jgi:tRNA A-37 threonylcarbamoyl transferase component Bud32
MINPTTPKHFDSKHHVSEDGGMIKKVYLTKGWYTRELNFYLKMQGKVDFIPKIIRNSPETNTIWFENCGLSLAEKYDHLGRMPYKSKIKDLVEELKKFGFHHNDVRWKNVLENNEGKLFLIDFEGASNQYTDIDREHILNPKNQVIKVKDEKATNNSRITNPRLQS